MKFSKWNISIDLICTFFWIVGLWISISFFGLLSRKEWVLKSRKSHWACKLFSIHIYFNGFKIYFYYSFYNTLVVGGWKRKEEEKKEGWCKMCTLKIRASFWNPSSGWWHLTPQVAYWREQDCLHSNVILSVRMSEFSL